MGAGRLCRGAVDNRVNDVVSAAAHPNVPIGNVQKGLDIFLSFLIPGLFGKPQYRLEVVVKIVEALGVFLQVLVERLIIAKIAIPAPSARSFSTTLPEF